MRKQEINNGKIRKQRKNEYFSIFAAVGSDYTLKYLQSFLSFGTGCYLIASLLDSLGNGMLNMKTILLIYTWRETGLIFSLCETLYKISGNPGEFLAPWIRKRFHFKQRMLIGLGFDLAGAATTSETN